MNKLSPPVVLTLSGHDPSGGAGIQADIESIFSQGCQACSIITALTTQDSCDIKSVIPQPAKIVSEQLKVIMNDIKPAVIKIGLIGSVEVVDVLHEQLKECEIPIILDPVLASGRGTELASQALIEAIQTKLLPITTLLTPNSIEARRLAPKGKTVDECGLELLRYGCKEVLITGAHEESKTVDNRLYNEGALQETFSWDRLPYSYHGSGCTLASSIAALLARGLPLFAAIHEAQEFTWQALEQGFKPGKGQHFPNRFFWATDD